MNKDLFEQLLYEEESPTLDFKKEQYRFAKATDDEKSELLKDILGFANAWRRAPAFILIGVEDVRGGRAKVVGVPSTDDHLDDHSLQQFVNNLTNQPVRFRYEAFGFEGKQVGIISIDEHIRPIYLKKDYGKLEKEKVYVRRGSSTDPKKPAAIEEIAQMRIGSGQPAAEVLVQFAHFDRDDALGQSIAWGAEYCEMPDSETIPDLSDTGPLERLGIGISILHYNSIDRVNDEFLRELANYEFLCRLLRPVRLLVTNVGQVAASNVHAELTIPVDIGVAVMCGSEMPSKPRRRLDIASNIVLGHTQHPSDRHPGKVLIRVNDERYRVEIDCGDLQPGRRVWSDVFYVGIRESGNVSLTGLAFADNLPYPNEFALSVSVTVERTVMSLAELRSLP